MSHEQDNLSEGDDQLDNKEHLQNQGDQYNQLEQQRQAHSSQLDDIVKGLQSQQKKYQLKDMDLSSIFVNNLEENTSEDDIREYFKDCGPIEKITLRTDKITGLLYAYLQFATPQSVEDAILLTDGMIRGRKIKVFKKRTNLRSARGNSRGRGSNLGMGMQFRGRYSYAPPIRGRGLYRGRYGQFGQ